MSYSYLASQVPTVIAPTSPPSILGCTNTTTTAATFSPQVAGLTFNPLLYNQMLAQIATTCGYGAGSYGVAHGLTLSAPVSGLQLQVAPGYAMCMGVVAMEATGTTIVVPDATSLVFIWLLQTGALTYTTTTTPPAANCVYIGNCTTSGGNITAVDFSGVPYCVGGITIRYTNDRSAPSDTPNSSISFLTVTNAATYHWNGGQYNLYTSMTQGAPQYSASLTGNLTLTKLDNKMQFYVVASGANRTVLLPDPATLNSGWSCYILNAGGSNNILVKDSTGSTTYCTLTPGQGIAPFTVPVSGSPAFPSGPWTGGLPTPSPAPSPS